MLVTLLELFGSAERGTAVESFASSVFPRMMAAVITGFLLTLIIGPVAIRWLKARCRERIASDSARLNELHAAKKDTPTMGGLFVVTAVVLSTLLWTRLTNGQVLTGLFVVAGLTVIGAIDDWVKLNTAKKGLTPRQKLAGQIVVAALAATALVVLIGHRQIVPATGVWLWYAFVIVAGSNAVNLTDGLDGLAAGCTICCATAFAGLCWLSGSETLANRFGIVPVAGAGEFAVLTSALAGAMAGFLKFNRYPARVFLGDTGSLPIGGLLATAAIVCRQELLLILIGGVFVVETLSVILQVSWFKLTRRRLIRCSPLHNHYLFRGDHETTIVKRFWIGSAVCALAGIAVVVVR